MSEIAFSEDGKYFSAISSDGRLKIWDTETNVLKQEYTPDLHLTSPPTCLQWITVANSVSSKTNQSNSNENVAQCIALGTTNGRILLYSVTQAKVCTVLETANEDNNGIIALDWHRQYGLFTCNNSNIISEWDLANGRAIHSYNNVENNVKQNVISAIKIIPHKLKSPAKFLVTASWQVRLWRLLDGTATLVLNLGHTGSQKPMLNLALFAQTAMLVLGSQNERLISFWDVSIKSNYLPESNGVGGHTKKRKVSLSDAPTLTTPTFNFVLEDAPKMVDVDMSGVQQNGEFTLLATTRSCVVHYYRHQINKISPKPVKPSVTIQYSTPQAKPLPLKCCKLANDGVHVLLGYEAAPARLHFERCIPETKSKTQILIRGEVAEKKNRQADVNKVRSDVSGNVTYVEPMGGVVRKRAEPGGTIEVPMEARLENLALDPANRSVTAVNQNLTKLLVQGLHSGDKALIRTVVQKNDAAVAMRSVANLPMDYVPALLDVLIEMTTGKTSQCACACTWLFALLRCHAAVLMASLSDPAANDRLAKMLASLRQRGSHLSQLLQLKGRLELVTTLRSQQGLPSNDEAVIDYNDNSSEDEMELHHESDRESWNEDEEDEEVK